MVIKSEEDNLAPEPVEDDGLVTVVVEEENPPVEEPKGPSYEELIATVSKQNQVIEQLMASNKESTTALGNALGGLKGLGGKTPEQPTQPAFDETKYQEEFDNNFMVSPYQALKKMNNQMLLPAFQQLMQTVGDKTEISKELLLANPNSEDAKYYVKYQQEVEDELSKMPMDKKHKSLSVVKEALAAVKLRHLDDIINDKVLEKVKEQEANGPKTETTVVVRPNTPTAVGGGVNPPPGKKGKTYVISAEQRRADEKAAFVQGVSLEKYQAWKYKNGVK